jgi:CheY-like chemotaxis protein
MESTIKQKILLVDDRPENILVLENILEESDREFVKAYSGKEALKYLLKDDYALILLDVQMPEMDGFEAASIIRGREKSKNIPIVFVTAISNEDKNIFKGYEAGAVDFLHKPVNPDILKSKVKIFLEMDRQKQILEKQNQELILARRNTDNIFTYIEEGLFLLDENYQIQPQYSAALEKILCNKQLASNNFLSVIKSSINKDIFNNVSDYFDLLFQNEVDEMNFLELNPLINIEYQNNNGNEDDKKYLSFHFKRIKEEDQISGIMATVMDNTEQILLEKKLRETEEQSRRQVKLLQLLQTEPQLLKEFLLQTEKELLQIKQEIKKLSSGSNNSDTLEIIYRTIHSIKGNANLFDLEFMVNTAHQFEEILMDLKEKPKVINTNRDQLNLYIDEMSSNLEEINILVDKLKQFYMNFNEKNSSSGDLLISAIKNLIVRFNQELNKNIEFKHKDFKTEAINSKDFLVIKDILIQLVRNAVYHGIEETEVRKKKGKNSKAIISLSSKIINDILYLTIRDDGRGLQTDKLSEKAISLGRWSKDQIMKWSTDKITNLIYESGISTSVESGLVAGRGMGMQIIKKKVEELKGNIEINFEPDNYCEFMISIPLLEN